MEAVEAEYVDAFRVRRRVPSANLAAVQRAMGIQPGETAADAPDPVRLVRRPGEIVEPAAELVLEDGSSQGIMQRLPRDLPHGYHLLRRDHAEQMLIVAPATVRVPAGRSWGWAAQLYAARSHGSWGIGDLADLRSLAAWSRDVGAAYLMVNPLNAPSFSAHPEPSPYFPSTRRFRDPLYLSIEEVGGASLAPETVQRAAAAGRALNAERLIDRARVQQLKGDALAAIWDAVAGGVESDAGLRAYRQDQGDGLRHWATFAAIAEAHGSDWRAWPGELRDPAALEVARFEAGHAARIRYHEWLQWLLDEQLRRAGAQGVGLVTDLPIGFDPGGFDAWAWQSELALGAAVGSPPDQFNPVGQDWGLPPFAPHRLRASRYAALVATLRGAMRHAGGLRIDHVLGLFRQWWVPNGSSPDQGAYVRYAADEQLAILAIESERATAIVVGEDLGTVGAGVRRRLRQAGVLSTRLAYFERDPSAIPKLAMAAITNHDLPTVAGTWTGADLAELKERRIPHYEEAERGLRRRIARLSGQPTDAAVDDVALGAYGALAAGPAIVVTATLEDACFVAERVNVPGTTDRQRPNWSLALPDTIEELRTSPFAARLAAAIAAGRAAEPAGGRDAGHSPGRVAEPG